MMGGALPERWQDAFTVIDFETTGVDTDVAQPVELGVVRFEGGAMVEQCNYTLKPSIPIPEGASKIHGLYDSDVAHAPLFADVWPLVADMFEDAVPVAYNAPFDRRVLYNAIRRPHTWPKSALAGAHILNVECPWIDPLVFVAREDKFQRSKRLTEACKRRGIVIDNAHRALDDCLATGALLLALKAPPLHPVLSDLVVKQQELAVAKELDYRHYKNRKAGNARLDGRVYVCDSCASTGFSADPRTGPSGWASYGREKEATCTVGCDAHLLWRDAGARSSGVDQC